MKPILVFSFTIIFSLSNNLLTVNAASNPFDFSREGSLDTVSVKAHDIVENIRNKNADSYVTRRTTHCKVARYSH